MAEAATELDHLECHAALASRLIRTKPALQNYFRWLSRPAMRGEPTQLPTAPVKTCLDSLINPLRSDADRITQRETETASIWLGAICEYIAQRNHTLGNGNLLRLIAASLLPLYRALATGRLQEGLAQTRFRLGETLVLLGLNECLQLRTLLDASVGPQCSPHRSLNELLKLDPANIHYLITSSLDGYNQARDQFNSDTVQQLLNYRAGEKLPVGHQVPDWAAPQLLWVLSNEITSSRAELVLPRSWIDIPVPWNKISSHWTELECHLSSLRSEVDKARNGKLAGDSAGYSELEENNIGGHSTDSGDAYSRASAIVEAAQSGLESLDTMDAIDRVIESEISKPRPADRNRRLRQTGSNAAVAPTAPVAKKEPIIIPKVLIGEISNHNDPAFANVVRRQVGVCKQEDRSICVSMIQVTALDLRENQSLSAPHDNGLNRWQQKLVNWICDHPELKQPAAFLTRDGHLILVVMDTERNAMTRVLRQGLYEILTGQKNDMDSDLSKVNIPAKFHAGISSTSSPGASFEFEELIASAHRCFSAAQRLGSASIKSIEVF
ncbi:MAG: hypothetical protein U0930_23500 [Pirellulales bacterium]